MITFWIIISIILLISIIGQIIPVLYGHFPDLSGLLLIAALEVATLSFAYKQYKKKSEKRTDLTVEEQKLTENSLDKFDLMFWFKRVLEIEYLDHDFREDLEHCEKYLIYFEQERIYVKSILLNQIKTMLMSYYDLLSLNIPTERSLELQSQIESFFKSVRKSFFILQEQSSVNIE